MKITRKNLEKIIKEEIEEVMRTVSADRLDLESTVNEQIFTHSGPIGSRAELDQLKLDIETGKKDSELGSYASAYRCDRHPDGLGADAETTFITIHDTLCPAIKKRKAMINSK